MVTVMTEQVISVLASRWRFHWFLVFMLCMQMLLLAFNNVVNLFYHDSLPHHCTVPDDLPLNVTLPKNEDTNSKQPYSSCKKYVDPSNHTAGVETCKSYSYQGEQTIVSEFDLVCDLSYLPSLISTLYFVGQLIGAMVGGDLADRFGRRPVIIIGMYLQTSLGIIIYFNKNLSAYIFCRTLLGAVTDAIYSTSNTLLMEYSPIHMRGRMGALFSMAWGIGSIFVGIFAYLGRDWRTIQLCITLPFVFSCIYLLCLPESLRWLLSTDKTKEARKTVDRYAKWNGVKLEENIYQQLDDLAKEIKASSHKTTSYTYLDLLRTPEMRKRTCVLATLVLSMALCYYGILFNLTALGGNKYTNFLFSATLEVVAYILTLCVVSRINRRPLYMAISISGSILCALGVLLKRFSTADSMTLASSIVILISKAGAVSSFAVMNTYLPELFPTVVRNMGFSFCLFSGRIGSLLAPQMVPLGEHTDEIVPFVLFAALYFGAAISPLILPETKDRPIPETIQAIEKRNLTDDHVMAEVNKGKANKGFEREKDN